MEQGYAINHDYDCIDRESFDEVRRRRTRWSRDVREAKRGAEGVARRGSGVFAERRARGVSRPRYHAVRAAACRCRSRPPICSCAVITTSGGLGKLAAFVTPRSARRRRTSGDRLAHGRRQQFARGFLDGRQPAERPVRERIPQGGHRHDVPDAARWKYESRRRANFSSAKSTTCTRRPSHVAKLPYVDPARIYLGGHSTGGTLALLVAEIGGRFAGGVRLRAGRRRWNALSGIARAAGLSLDARSGELRLRSPLHWLAAISTRQPT